MARNGVPTYRKRRLRGRDVAYVTLTDHESGKRCDHWLGAYDTPASREKYCRLLADWEAAGRRRPTASPPNRRA